MQTNIKRKLATASLCGFLAIATGQCKLSEEFCAIGDPFCNPALAALLYTYKEELTAGWMLPGAMHALKPAATAGDYSYQVLQGSGWVTNRGIYTARAMIGVAIIEASKSDGSIEYIELEVNATGGNGTFASEIASAACTTHLNLEVADFNGDQFDDVILSCAAAGIKVLLSNGDGTFRTTATISTSGNVEQVQRGDFNGDGILDIAAAFDGSNSPGLGVYLGNGDGTFQGILGFTTTQTSKNSGSLNQADFNNDGIHDLVLLNQMDIDQYRGTGDSTALNAFSLGAYASANGAVEGNVEDFNNDGFVDLAIAVVGEMDYHQNNGSGTFTTYTNHNCGGGFISQDTVPGDYNNDRSIDLACPQNSNILGTLLGQGDGNFNLQANNTANSNGGAAMADFNGDGNLDLAVTDNSNHQIGVYLGNGDGIFQTAVIYGSGSSISSPGKIRTGDFNNDRIVDLIVPSSTNNIHVLLGK